MIENTFEFWKKLIYHGRYDGMKLALHTTQAGHYSRLVDTFGSKELPRFDAELVAKLKETAHQGTVWQLSESLWATIVSEGETQPWNFRFLGKDVAMLTKVLAI